MEEIVDELQTEKKPRSSPTPANAHKALFRAINLSKSYGGLKAVNKVSFDVYPGEVLALVGDNGAGKSTLIKALSGAQPPDEGEMQMQGVSLRLRTPNDASEAGIGCLHQGLGLVDSLNVPENVFLGRELQSRFLGVVRQLDRAEMRRRTIELLERFQISLPKLNEPVIRLSGGQRQTIAISRLLLQEIQLMIMDEPMAALGVDEGKRVLELVRNMRARGISIIIISHNLEHVFQIADRIAVMKNGQLVKIVETAETTRDEIVGMITFGKAA
ncbi:MAG: ATP-binding cassette domain-containing protein [Granulosicoccus sp.]|nr:ATP-binding cassette domain-containing protein [Granulosicoccus sp.]